MNQVRPNDILKGNDEQDVRRIFSTVTRQTANYLDKRSNYQDKRISRLITSSDWQNEAMNSSLAKLVFTSSNRLEKEILEYVDLYG